MNSVASMEREDLKIIDVGFRTQFKEMFNADSINESYREAIIGSTTGSLNPEEHIARTFAASIIAALNKFQSTNNCNINYQNFINFIIELLPAKVLTLRKNRIKSLLLEYLNSESTKVSLQCES